MKGAVAVFGATSGIGRAIAKRLAAESTPLVLLARDADELQRTQNDLTIRFGVVVKTLVFDACDYSGHSGIVQRCFQLADLDGVILCHGYNGTQALAEKDFEEARRIVETNYLSPVSLLLRAAHLFEERRRGFLCVVTSVAGDRGRPSNYVYGSAKGGLSIFLEGLRARLFRAGVGVIDVRPGFVDTAMTFGLPGLFWVASPDKVARDICRAIQRQKDILYTPGFWSGILWVIRHLPRFLFKRLRL